MKFVPIIACLLLAGSALAVEPPFTAKVVAVHDGDTCMVYDGVHDQMKIRLSGIDAPELKQPYGKASKDQLSKLIFGQTVLITPHGKDRYRRTLAEITFHDHRVNEQMVALGAAWHWPKYSKSPILAKAQLAAAKAQRGLWLLPGPVPPWDWRIVKN